MMKKWLLRALYAFLVLMPIGAIADYTATTGTGSTVFAFVCFTTKICPAQVLMNSAGTEIGTSGNPVRIDPTGSTTQPVSAASLPLPTGASTSANQTSTNTKLDTIITNTSAAIPAGTANIGNVGQISQYPTGATAITASNTGTTAATTATLAGAVGKTTYICGYSIRANATAAATVTNTITGVITATLSSIMWVAPLASGIGIDEQIFSPCIPASATNTGIAIVSGAPGSGGTVSSKGWGYQL